MYLALRPSLIAALQEPSQDAIQETVIDGI
jgi:hypothetical protein